MLTALLDDKADFVELFLSNGLSMSEFLSAEILCQLYAGVRLSISFDIHLSDLSATFTGEGASSSLLVPLETFCVEGHCITLRETNQPKKTKGANGNWHSTARRHIGE